MTEVQTVGTLRVFKLVNNRLGYDEYDVTSLVQDYKFKIVGSKRYKP